MNGEPASSIPIALSALATSLIAEPTAAPKSFGVVVTRLKAMGHGSPVVSANSKFMNNSVADRTKHVTSRKGTTLACPTLS